jgi:hypothetical protein
LVVVVGLLQVLEQILLEQTAGVMVLAQVLAQLEQQTQAVAVVQAA